MMNKIILGTAQFGLNYGINNNKGKPNDLELEKILLKAYESKILFLDTAEAYGDAQKRIGIFHERFPEKKFNIITKFYEEHFLGNFKTQILNDLQELKIETLYAYLFHNFNDLKKYSNNIDNLIQLKDDGLINKIGVSLYTNKEIKYVLDEFDFIDLIQIPFNLFDNFKQRGDFLIEMKQKGIEVYTRSVFLQGLFFKEDINYKLSVLKPHLELINNLCKKHSISISELALNYCLKQPLIDKVLIGVDTAQQLTENLNNINNLDPEIIKEINNINIKEKELLNPSNW